ncbi:histidine kinase [Imperialibacter roseus]|uniref:Histidine kinase n=1 Tax=Imperialibacter roseus TaxID=1324217 RepID=A0ABZ0IPH9_9BACT|nr:histidine kinase [Imperialibacter roseus]WOK06369.1 histidine kinase [Imperialibacter roseus]
MKRKLFYNHLISRLFAPLPLGMLIYMLVLLVFDNLGSLGEVFFEKEALLCIGITYLVAELLRAIANGFVPRIESSDFIKLSFGLLFLAGLLVTLLVVFGSISAYFVGVIGYSFGTFTTELSTFLSIYGFIYALYFIVLASVILFTLETNRALDKEGVLKKNIDLKLRIFSRVINPEFLYKSLETLISILYKKDKAADKFIQKLSHVYRSVLDSRHEDLSEMKAELTIAESIVYLYNQQYDGNIHWQPESEAIEEEAYLLPGSMMIVMEWIIASNMINQSRPLKIFVRREEDYLTIEYSLWERLMPTVEGKEKMMELLQSFEHFTERPLLIVKADNKGFVKLPLLKLEKAA